MTAFRKIYRRPVRIALLLIVLVWCGSVSCFADPAEDIRAVFLPATSFQERKISLFLHYAAQADLNAVVLHVKDPRGHIYWDSQVSEARRVKAFQKGIMLEQTIRQLKENNIRVIAKIDVFADTAYVKYFPGRGVGSIQTGGPWADKVGGLWSNPYDTRVWDYNIALSRELAHMRFDEIQFDYVRFPSDGDLGKISYPVRPEGLTPALCIGRFLKTARSVLKPYEVQISADVFGMTAWKKGDFGVGQVIEEMAPHVDVICPMFYPSHFPEGFLGLVRPGDHPDRIMALSMDRMKQRIRKPIRPWIQGFWYDPEDITAQIRAVQDSSNNSWSVWNASGEYGTTWEAIARMKQIRFKRPEFYPSLDQLRPLVERSVRGKYGIVNFTSYETGYTILTLEPHDSSAEQNWSTPIQLLATLDEAVMDRILKNRHITVSPVTGRQTKIMHLSRLMAADLKADPRRMRPGAIYINWKGESIFLRQKPWESP